MKIASVTPYSHPEFPNLIHVEVTTNDGIVGVGESYYFGATVAHFIKEFSAPALVGKDPLARDEISRILTTYVGYNSSGVETRARSAIDIALWDIAGKSSGQPLYKLLGAKESRDLKIYNTCAGRQYMRRSNQGSNSWGLDFSSDELEDLKAFMSDAGNLAKSLLSEGITAMKIWPFDIYAEKNWGAEISDQDLNEGLEPLRKIRETVGMGMDVMIELHALWSPTAAKKIMEALREFNVFWVEDPIYPDLLDDLALLRGNSMPPIAHGETIASLERVRILASRNLIDFLTLDLSWCGGITTGLKFAEIAKAHDIKIAPHDCTGPVGLMAAAHLSTADRNAVMQETVRSSLRTWYPYLVQGLPNISAGSLRVGDAAGHGLILNEEFKDTARLQNLAVNL